MENSVFLGKLNRTLIKRYCLVFFSSVLLPILYIDFAVVPGFKLLFISLVLGVSIFLGLLLTALPIKNYIGLIFVSVLAGVIALGVIQYVLYFKNAP
jgi:hypothetical protein